MLDYSTSNLNLDRSRWYFTQFFANYYRNTESWEETRSRFDHVSETVETLIDSYLDVGVFGPDELTALKSVTQIDRVVGKETTRLQIEAADGNPNLKQRVLKLLDQDVPKGIVGGQAFHIQDVGEESETVLLDSFSILLDDTATAEEYNRAVSDILKLDVFNVDIGTWSPIFCLLRPYRYPIVNKNPETGFDTWFDMDLSTDSQDYFETIETIDTVRDKFRFDEHHRQLDWFFYWAREQTDITEWYEENDIESRDVWQINAGNNRHNEPERLWPLWREEGICSIGWDIGDLRTLSENEVDQRAEEYSGENEGKYLKRFGKAMRPGQIVIARNGQRILGIGVTQANGYQYCGDWIEGQTNGVHHPHIWPIEWKVFADERPDTGHWDVSPGLHRRETLLPMKNFEELRFAYGNIEQSIQHDLVDIERSVESPTMADLPTSCSSSEIREPVTDSAPYYWVNQGLEQVEGEYLQAPTREVFQYDLPKLEIGDKVFSYNDGQVLGYHTVTEPAYIVQVPIEELESSDSDSRTEPRYRVETSFTRFDQPLPFASVFETLLEYKLDKYYPVDSGGIKQQYLYNLSEEAGENLLEKTGGEKTYNSLTEAEADIRSKLEERSSPADGLRAAQVKATIKNWTEALQRNDLAAKSVRRGDYETLGEIKSVYESNEESLEIRTARLNVGSLDDCSPAQVLFIILIRELQREADVSQPNLNHINLPNILSETYKDESILSPPHTVPDDTAELERQLRAKHQLIFHGPPGTSKTFTAQQFARWWLHKTKSGPDEEQLQMVTFHPSFTYEDFIEGLEAKQGDDGAVEYNVESGAFREFASRAKDAYEAADSLEEAPNYVLIIDEINRGNLAQIFGETITLLEGDKRLDAENETNIMLPHSGEEFYVPPNLYIIGTMNTADRSIALVDAALRRRFRFIHFGPDLDIVCKEYGFPGGDLDGAKTVARNGDDRATQLLALSVCAVDALNAEIRNARDLGRGKQIGHTPLLGIDGEDVVEREQAILDIWRYEIMSLLEEYYFGQFERIDQELFDGNGELLFDSDTHEIQDFSARELAKACSGITDGLENIWESNGGE